MFAHLLIAVGGRRASLGEPYSETLIPRLAEAQAVLDEAAAR